MSQADVNYSCGSCAYPLNLNSSNRIMTGTGVDYRKLMKKGIISFLSVDLSRFTQVDTVNCILISRPKTKLLCRKCGFHIGYGYGESSSLCGKDSNNGFSSSPTHQKYTIKIRALQPSEQS